MDLRSKDVHTMQVFETLCGLTQCFHELDNLNFLKKAFWYMLSLFVAKWSTLFKGKTETKSAPKESSVQIEMIQIMCFS